MPPCDFCGLPNAPAALTYCTACCSTNCLRQACQDAHLGVCS